MSKLLKQDLARILGNAIERRNDRKKMAILDYSTKISKGSKDALDRSVQLLRTINTCYAIWKKKRV